MVDVQLKCKCGEVQGVASGVSGKSGTRLICYCADCQEFAAKLDFDDVILDENGGTDIFQMSPKHFEITKGAEHIKCLRLTPKGLFRWYAGCCNTPIGNTVSANIPFVGVVHNFMDDQGNRDQNIGPVYGANGVKSAIGQVPENSQHASEKRLIMRSIGKILMAKLSGHAKYTPFFDAAGKPIAEPTIVNE